LTGTHTHLPGENLIGMLFPLQFGTCKMTPAIATASTSVNPSGNNKVFKKRSLSFHLIAEHDEGI
jgi:hypothetical protein